MPIILNKELYNKIKNEADKIYKKSSAYKSGYIVKKYKEMGGKYREDNEPKNLKRWFKEKWVDVSSFNSESANSTKKYISGEVLNKVNYPVYRPTKRISKLTPLTVDEIDTNNLKKQIILKQKIKGNKNLPKFKNKNNII